jgi:hypothetical protein
MQLHISFFGSTEIVGHPEVEYVFLDNLRLDAGWIADRAAQGFLGLLVFGSLHRRPV